MFKNYLNEPLTFKQWICLSLSLLLLLHFETRKSYSLITYTEQPQQLLWLCATKIALPSITYTRRLGVRHWNTASKFSGFCGLLHVKPPWNGLVLWWKLIWIRIWGVQGPGQHTGLFQHPPVSSSRTVICPAGGYRWWIEVPLSEASWVVKIKLPSTWLAGCRVSQQNNECYLHHQALQVLILDLIIHTKISASLCSRDCNTVFIELWYFLINIQYIHLTSHHCSFWVCILNLHEKHCMRMCRPEHKQGQTTVDTFSVVKPLILTEGTSCWTLLQVILRPRSTDWARGQV